MNGSNIRLYDYQWHRVNAARLRGEAIGNAIAVAAAWTARLWRQFRHRLAVAIDVPQH